MNKKETNDNKHQPSRGGEADPAQNYPPNYPPPGWYAAYGPEEEDEIDLAELAKVIWDDRIMIAKIVGVFFVLGLIIALFSAVEYETDALLLPEAQSSQSRAQNLLQQYGGLIGMGGGSNTGQNETIPPQLFPKIIESIPYQMELMNTAVHFRDYDTTATVHQFFKKIYRPSLLGYIAGYTVGLPGKIIGLFKKEEPAGKNVMPSDMERDSIYTITKEQMQTIEQLKNRVTVQIDQETGVLTYSVEMPDPLATAEVAHAGLKLLKGYVEEYRTRKAEQDLKFVRTQTKNAGDEFDTAQQKLAEFRDSNIDLTSARAQTRQQELQSAFDLNFNIYNSLRQQVEQAKLKIQEDTPVFSILQPVTIPLNKSKPNRKLIVVVSLILGLIIGIGWSLIRSWSKDFMQNMQQS